jgi:spore maturation protein SpmB
MYWHRCRRDVIAVVVVEEELRLDSEQDLPVRNLPNPLSSFYILLIEDIDRPGFLNSLAGVISTVVNVYTQQNGHWSLTAEVTMIVTGSCMVITGALVLLYDLFVLRGIRNSHRREIASTVTHEVGTAAKGIEKDMGVGIVDAFLGN